MGTFDLLKGIVRVAGKAAGTGLEVAATGIEGWTEAQHARHIASTIWSDFGILEPAQGRLHEFLISAAGDYVLTLAEPNWTDFTCLVVDQTGKVCPVAHYQKVELLGVNIIPIHAERHGVFRVQVVAKRGYGKYSLALRRVED
jgi:hypothetical protein